MAAVSRAWLSDMARPTRLTRRAAHWAAHASELAAQRARGAVRSAHGTGRRVTATLASARVGGQQRLRQASQELRESLLPEAGARARRLSRQLPLSIAVLFLGCVVTGAVYGLSASVSQTLTTFVCAATLWLLLFVYDAQQRQAAAMKRSLDELRASLHVTHALLEATELQGAEELRSTLLPDAPDAPEPTGGDARVCPRAD
jgi:Flp pilus assembly protein TadB